MDGVWSETFGLWIPSLSVGNLAPPVWLQVDGPLPVNPQSFDNPIWLSYTALATG